MLQLKTGETVWWIEKKGEQETFHVGVLLRYMSNQVLTLNGGCRISKSIPRGDSVLVLVRHNRTCDETESILEEFVPWNALHHYYGDKQPGDMEPHHVSEKRLENIELYNLRLLSLPTVRTKSS